MSAASTMDIVEVLTPEFSLPCRLHTGSHRSMVRRGGRLQPAAANSLRRGNLRGHPGLVLTNIPA